MDLGTGTGIWSIVVADRLYGRTGHQPVVMAVDLHKFQSRLIPPGMTTVQFDIEDLSWNSLITGCDLVHIRLLFGSIHHEMWPEIYRRIFHHLTPGSGYVEHVEIDWVPRWDKYTMPQASALKEWSDRFLGALDRFNRSARVDSTAVHRTIEGAGFTNFREEIIRCYVNPWMSDPHEQDVANWFNIAFSRGVDAMSFVPMIEGLGMSQSKVQDLCTRVKKEICVLAHHAYFDIHIWSARRSPD
ncbi:methyltransferase LaeA [Metarhizium anisopliae]|nr:methyltransferase LaeA [Metarhizium anisopliae]